MLKNVVILKSGSEVTQGHRLVDLVWFPIGVLLVTLSLKRTIQSGTHDFLLTFHSNHRPISHRFRDKWQYPSKIANFPHPRVFNAPAEGVPLKFGIGARGPEYFYDVATRWSKKF